MKTKYVRTLVLSAFVFVLGVSLGAILQKTVGVGNLLRASGIPYPTPAPSAGPTVLPVVNIPAAYQGQILLFLLVGQSNMVGWAPLPLENPTDPRIFVFSNDYQWRLAHEPVDNAYNQVDHVSLDRIAFFGPSMPFAFASLDHEPQVAIGLIPCAKNSSGIIQWQRNMSDQTLYGSCLKRARAASPLGRLAGVLVFQGETDAQNPILYPDPEPHAIDWAHLFTALIADLRTDLHEPELPIVFAQLGPTPLSEDFPNWALVKEQQASISLPMTAMITTDDLTLMDGLHFTAQSYRTIGIRFAKAYWSLVEQEQVK